MVLQDSVLATLVRLVDRIPMPETSRTRGRPRVYPDRLFVKALVIMIVRHLPKVHSLPPFSEVNPLGWTVFGVHYTSRRPRPDR